jgi:outer membrane protein OmpA-like peptidoglycan-associated protein
MNPHTLSRAKLGPFFIIQAFLCFGLTLGHCTRALAETPRETAAGPRPLEQKPIEQKVSEEISGEIYAFSKTERTAQVHPSLWGQAGLFRMRSAESLPEGALTFGIGGEFYSITQGPVIGGIPNAATTIAESLFIGYSPWKDWTFSVQRRNSSTTFAAPGAADDLISSLGDFTFSGAYSIPLSTSLAMSPFVDLQIASNFNNLAPAGSTMSVGLGSAFTYSLFPATSLPLFLHANATYHMPQIRGGAPAGLQPETFFRFSRFHQFDLGLGAEYQVGDFNPFFEFHTGVRGGSALGFLDPTYITLGVRTTPLDNKSLAFLLGADFNVKRGNVPGVAYLPPMQLIGLVSYTFGLQSSERVHYYTTRDVRIVNRKFIIRKHINFEVGKAILLPESTVLLDQIADVIQQNQVRKLLIVGHTDSTSNEDFNEKLSLSRAETVKRYLSSKGVSEDSLSVQGYGKRKPKATNLTEAGRALNRRVEFFILE